MMAKPTIGVVGLGTMGLGIAQVYAAAGFPVIATDAHAAARDNARDRMVEALAARVTAGKLTPEARDQTLANFCVAPDLTAFSPCALVIEAIVEKPEAKQALFAALDGVLAKTAVLATNTSSIPVATIATDAPRPDRILALHFFNPPTAMRLVELAPHAGTSAEALALARQITEAAGKTVIQCPDRPGFIVNRCARPFYGEALAMLEEGRSASDIDAACLAAGYRLGPFALIDLIGADINLAATTGMYAAMSRHPRYYPFDALKAQVASGHLGRKTGQGFVFPAQPGPAPDDAAEIVLRIEATLANEAAWLLSEGGTSAQGIDTAMKLGLNFPRGPFEALASHGSARILSTLAALAAKAPSHLKPRYRPAPGLEAL
jgi:3-hydroxybutyryl-CoA dehydrogenase